MRRRDARKAAFMILFEEAARSADFRSDVAGEIARYFHSQGGLDEASRGFTSHLVAGVVERRDAIDAAIAGAGSQWRIDRMDRVELTLLRLGVFELSTPDATGEVLPREIVIDEAVELAKIYGGEGSAAFVNGVLDAVASRQNAS